MISNLIVLPVYYDSDHCSLFKSRFFTNKLARFAVEQKLCDKYKRPHLELKSGPHLGPVFVLS